MCRHQPPQQGRQRQAPRAQRGQHEQAGLARQQPRLVEALAGFYLPEGFKDVAAYVLLLVVLALRPQGLFAQTAAKKV